MARKVNKECQHCAKLPVHEAIELHGVDGDNCWNPDDVRKLGYNCHRRRHHYRHREDDNRNRRRMRKLAKRGELEELTTAQTPDSRLTEPINITAPHPPAIRAAVLVLYRNHKDAPVHAAAAEIWQGNHKIGELQPIHCMGMRGDQVTAYLQQILLTLREQYGVGRFEDVIKQLPVSDCPIEGCPFSQH